MRDVADMISGKAPLSILSPRELEVLGMVSGGLTNVEIAKRLDVTVHAVKFHLASVYRKLGVSNRTEAAGVYLTAPAAAAGGSE
jgi:DNA-binding CsgD family transcriptional regulator